MTWDLVGSRSATTATATLSFTTLAPDVSSGDILVLLVADRPETTTYTAPSGFTEVGTTAGVGMFYKAADGTETTVSVDASATSLIGLIGIMRTDTPAEVATFSATCSGSGASDSQVGDGTVAGGGCTIGAGDYFVVNGVRVTDETAASAPNSVTHSISSNPAGGSRVGADYGQYLAIFPWNDTAAPSLETFLYSVDVVAGNHSWRLQAIDANWSIGAAEAITGSSFAPPARRIRLDARDLPYVVHTGMLGGKS